jgi:aspartate/methionine/tyrosine aminotransferase
LGSEGEGYLRFSLTAPEDKIKEALERMKNYKSAVGGLEGLR